MSDDGKLTDAEWRDFQSIPDQGYSHRAWVDHKITQRVRKAQADALREAAGDIVWSAETLPDMTPHDAARGLVRRATDIEKED